ncbi:MAG: hypothetical protein V3R99_08815 [Thermoguttaceae bacterium]
MDRFLVGLLGVEAFLLASERFGWFAFNERRGWTVLITLSVVCLAVLLILLWLAVSLLFRRRFQFSIRSLCVLTLVVAIPCSWFAVKMQQTKRQREMVTTLVRAGGRVRYDHMYFSQESYVPKKRMPNPLWLVKLLGIDFLDNVTILHLYPNSSAPNRPLSDADLAYLESFPHLESLILSRKEVTDVGLVHLRNFSRLKELSLGTPKVTDRGLKHLKSLEQLRYLELGCGGVTDRGLVHLNSLKELRHLRLHCAVTDQGLAELTSLTQLEVLESYGATTPTVELHREMRALDDPTQMDFIETPLRDVMDFLGEFHRARITVDQEALRVVDVSRDVQITIHRKGITLDMALTEILTPHGLAWMITPDGIVITTKEIVDKELAGVARLRKSLPNLKKVRVCVDW